MGFWMKYLLAILGSWLRHHLNLKPFTYLAGFMAANLDACEGWRDHITPKLTELGIVVQDPTKDEEKKTGMEMQAANDYLYRLKRSGQRTKLVNLMKSIRHADLLAVARSAFIVIEWDNKYPTVGTISELEHAITWHKPIYLVTRNSLSSINPWLLSMAFQLGDVFRSRSECVEFIRGKYEARLHSDENAVVVEKIEAPDEVITGEHADSSVGNSVGA